MLSMSRRENIMPDMEMVERIIEELNAKFDPVDLWHHSTNNSEMFEFEMKTDNNRREAWHIVFMGCYTVASGGYLGYDYSDCQEEEYITLEAKNETKILMLATNGAINVINHIVEYMARSNVSNQNKQKWSDMFKNGIQEE